MKITQLPLSEPAVAFLKESGLEKLYPPQEQSVRAGLTEGRSLLVSAPTASGKTLIATMAMLAFLSRGSGKVVYLSPLRALASEKFAEFKKLQKIPLKRRVRVAVSTGDLERAGRGLGQSDVLILTNEKMDSLIRHGSDWLDDIGLVIADEVHLIGDPNRGPTLEMILTRVKQMKSKPQIVGLSATITNADELAKWLDAGLVDSDWRPVPLSEGVLEDGVVTMQDGSSHELEPTPRGPAVDLGAESVRDGGQSLLFAETRARSASLAAKASDVVYSMVGPAGRMRLSKISQKILDSNEHTPVVKTLAELVKKGVAFHHAGLNQSCRATIESEFRRGTIRLLSSTPTLAAGVNLPARRVVISSVSRYDARAGINMPISVLEYKQLCGRAGRPQYDELGEAIIVGRSSADAIAEHYIHGTPEPIESQITDDRALRIHVLSLISTSPGIGRNDIVEFFLDTLGGAQLGRATIKFGIGVALRFLTRENLIVEKGGRFAATEFGKKTTALYIDPMTATLFRDSLDGATDNGLHTLGFLYLVSECEEFYPKFGMRQGDHTTAEDLFEDHLSELLEPVTQYNCNRSLLALHSWISESSEVSLADSLKIESGDIHRMTETADWLVHCLGEIAQQLGRADLSDELDVLRRRVSYGIKEELLDLVRVRGIGRVRARRLYRGGIKTTKDLASAPVTKLARIDKIGPALAASIKQQLSKKHL